jgi:hypothetical protein
MLMAARLASISWKRAGIHWERQLLSRQGSASRASSAQPKPTTRDWSFSRTMRVHFRTEVVYLLSYTAGRG